MITLASSMHMTGVRATDVTAFMLHPTDEQYQAWWTGVHLEMHAIRGDPGTGQLVHIDEFVGPRRIKMNALVTEAATDRVTWRMRKVVDLPCWLTIRLVDDDFGCTITHTIKAGFSGLGCMLDPFLRLYFSPAFSRNMDDHFRIEFAKLADLLRKERGAPAMLPNPAP